MTTTPHADAVRRAALPEVLFTSDLALALDLPPEIAEASAVAGRLGRHFLVRGRIAILRDDFMEALQTRAAIGASAHKELLSSDWEIGGRTEVPHAQ